MPSEEQTFRENLMRTLSEIKTQVTKTNGRVSNLENWKWALIGGWAVLTVIVIPILSSFIQSGKL